MNSVTLYGRVTKDIETEETGKGKNKNSYARFTLAVADGKDAEGEKKTQFIPCIAWGSLAEVLGEYVQKGDRLCVRGRINIQNYEKDEETKWSFQVVATEADFVETKEESEEKGRSDKRKR